MTAKQFLAAGKEAGLCAYYTMWLYYHGHSEFVAWLVGNAHPEEQ